MQPWSVAVMVIAATAALICCAFVVETDVSLSCTSRRIKAPAWYIAAHLAVLGQVDHPNYRVLGPSIWPKTVWGRNCSSYSVNTSWNAVTGAAFASPAASANLSVLASGQQAMCQLPSVWRDCSQGIYIDVGTNVGVQLRKLYDPSQFPNAGVLGLFDDTFGTNRSRVCAIGVEANPAHTPWLQKLNAYFGRKGYQAIVLTETAASIYTGKATLHLDPGSPVEWGASLTQGGWQQKSGNTSNEAVVSLFDLPAFMAGVVRPILRQDQYERSVLNGTRPPTGMKMDVEGEEYALLPSLITNGGLCDLSMIYMELHPPHMKTPEGALVGMNATAVEDVFAEMRKANPQCTVRYTHLDDETYLKAHIEVPLPTR